MKTFLLLARIAWVLGTILSFALALMQFNSDGGEFGILSGMVGMLVGLPLTALLFVVPLWDIPGWPHSDLGGYDVWLGWAMVTLPGFFQWFVLPPVVSRLIWRIRNRNYTLPPWDQRDEVKPLDR